MYYQRAVEMFMAAGAERVVLPHRETVLVTERDEVIAELRPARRQSPPATEINDVLDDLATAGLITRAGQPKERWTWRVRGLGLPIGTAVALIDQLREER